jgi:hypothetical protein
MEGLQWVGERLVKIVVSMGRSKDGTLGGGEGGRGWLLGIGV